MPSQHLTRLVRQAGGPPLVANYGLPVSGAPADCRITQCSGLTDSGPSVLPPISATGHLGLCALSWSKRGVALRQAQGRMRWLGSRVDGEKHEGGEQDEVHGSLQSRSPARDDGEDRDDDR